MKVRITILFLLIAPLLFGQTSIPCASDILHEKAMQDDPMYRTRYEQWEQKCLARARTAAKTAAKGQALYTLPVVIHVIHQNGAENISDAQILKGIQHLNESYANTGYYDDNNGVATPFQFCLARRKPDGSATSGIERIVSPLTNMTMETQDVAVKDLSRWKPTDYINIWLVAEITSTSAGPGVAGYAYFPSSHGSNIDGLVFEARWFGSSPANSCVATHEMGHYLGLYHTFQGGCTNNDCLVDGDRVCDTPPDNSTAAVPCGSTVNTCNTDALSGFASDQPDMIINYMDYGDWNCYNAFTAGQSARMESSLLDIRSSLLESKACVDPCTIAFNVSFDASEHSISAGTSVHFTNTSLNNTNWEWRVDGILFSTAEHSDYLFGSIGTHIVTLLGNGADPNCTDVYTDTIEVSCPVKASFSLSPTTPVAGTGFTLTSTATGSTGWEWTINGMVVGTTAVLNYTVANPGIYNICLTAQSNFCNDQLCALIEVATPSPCSHPPCTEDCNNGIDDDNDGLIDCYDTYDCPCNVVPDCSTTEFNDKDFDARLAWRNTEDNVNVLSSPMIANLNPQTDDIPEIVVTKYGGVDDQLLIFKGDGSNASAPDGLTIAGDLSSYPAAAPCIADINNDGIPEVMVVCMDNKIRVYTNYTPGVNPPMTLWMTSQTTADYSNSHVYAADFDNDGKPELYAGNDVFSFDFSIPASPQLKLAAAGPFGPSGKISSFFASTNNSSVAVDLLTPADCGGDPDCDGLEIAAGYVIYSVDLTTADGDPAEIKIQRNLNTMVSGHNFKDGYTVFADVDLNGIPEVIVSGYDGTKRGVYVWNKTGFWTFFPNQNDNQYGTSIVSVANVFDDKTKGYATDFPEIIATNSKQLNCFNLHAAVATPATPYWWTLATTDYSGYTGVTTFDFNGDKILELVYRDEDNLRIMYGGPTPFPAGVDAKRNWDIFPGYSVTADEYPVVADVDGDGQAEIIYTANPDSSGGGRPNYGRLYVLESNELLHDPWISAREVWNQYNYFVSNIEDDLKVPKVQQTSWIEMPTLGSGKRPLNNFLFQVPKYDENFDPYLPLSDATVKVLNAECMGNSFQVQVEICNTGSASLKANLPVTFYRNGNPYTSPAIKIGTFTISNNTIGVGDCIQKTVTIPAAQGKIYAVVNDAGLFSAPLVLNDSTFYVTECDFLNNQDTFSLTKPASALKLGPDILGCATATHTFHAGSGYKSYKWQDASTDSTFTAWAPGKYWVEVTDFCNNTYRDTIEFKADPASLFDLGPDQKFCNNAHLDFHVNGFIEYEWYPKTDNHLSCNNCGNATADPTKDITYKLVAKTASGCYSVDSVRIMVHDSVLQQVNVSRCEGDNYLFDGTSIVPGNTKAFIYNSQYGCDSTVVVAVKALPKSTTSEAFNLCFGESAPVFGQQIGVTGVYSQHFTNMHGCDSLHIVTINVYPPVPNTAESKQICPGDSTLVFGSYVKTAGDYPKHFDNINGCDSLHTVSVLMYAAPQNTSETRRICPGDSTNIFGNYVKTAGVFPGHFGNINGCDSTHTISVSLYAPPQNTAEIRHICPGDSTNVFGNFVKTSGVFPGHFGNLNGCDSVHTVTVALFAPPTNTAETRKICPGDSTSVFGSFIKTAGVYPGHFDNINGCDSVHTITVSLYALPVNTAETRHICPGDSTNVFGNFVKTGGVYPGRFDNINGCDSVHTVTVQVYPQPQNTAELRNICPGDSTVVYGNVVKTSGVFPAHFGNINGCDSVHTVTVNVFAAPQNTAETHFICPGDSILVYGNYIKTTAVIPHHSANINGCDSIHTVTVGLYAPPQNTAASASICAGDSLLVFGSYVKTGGVYQKHFDNINGCDSVHTLTLTVFPAVPKTDEQQAICAGDSLFLYGNWVKQAGDYPFHFPNYNGCDSLHTVKLTVHPLPAPVLTLVPPGCDETAGSLNIQIQPNANTFSLDGGVFQSGSAFNNILPGTHQIKVRDGNQCEKTSVFTMPVPPPTHHRSDSVQVCAGDSVQVFGQWIKQAGVLNHTFSNIYGCDSVVNRTVQVLPQANVLLQVTQPTCIVPLGTLTLVSGTPGAQFSLDGTHFTAAQLFEQLTPGNYALTALTDEGCAQQIPFTVNEIEYPTLQLPGDTSIDLGQSIRIKPVIYPVSQYVFDWTPIQYLNCNGCPEPVATPLQNTEYKLVITDEKGCTATDRIQIKVNGPDIYVPNIFTPNNDQENDAFTIYTASVGVRKILELQIFDRWGSLIFRRNDFEPNRDDLGWHGDYKGSPMNPGVFVWWAKLEFIDGQQVLLKGDVTLMR